MSEVVRVTGPPEVTYVSEQDRAWVNALRRADSLPALRELCEAWGAWVPDARATAATLRADTFRTFRAGLLAKTDDLQWAERYGVIALPERLLEVSIVAQRFGAPFGTAAIRMCQEGAQRWPWLKEVVPKEVCA